MRYHSVAQQNIVSHSRTMPGYAVAKLYSAQHNSDMHHLRTPLLNAALPSIAMTRHSDATHYRTLRRIALTGLHIALPRRCRTLPNIAVQWAALLCRR
jgi:hypothetical protein